jgi:hypothetical protein
MATLRQRVEVILDREDPTTGLLILDKDLRTLAYRPPARDGSAKMILLDMPPAGPHHYPKKPPKLSGDPRNAPRQEDPPLEPSGAGSRTDSALPRVSPPEAEREPKTPPEKGRGGWRRRHRVRVI